MDNNQFYQVDNTLTDVQIKQVRKKLKHSETRIEVNALREARSKLEKGQRLDLNGCNLYGIKLYKEDKELLKDAALNEVFLIDATLYETDLEKADLKYGILYNAYLNFVNLKGANLIEAHLETAFLTYCDLREAHLEGVNLTKAYLVGSDFGGAYLEKAILRGADLSKCNLIGANLTNSNLMGADLTSTTFDETTRLDEVILDINTKLSAELYQKLKAKNAYFIVPGAPFRKDSNYNDPNFIQKCIELGFIVPVNKLRSENIMDAKKELEKIGEKFKKNNEEIIQKDELEPILKEKKMLLSSSLEYFQDLEKEIPYSSKTRTLIKIGTNGHNRNDNGILGKRRVARTTPKSSQLLDTSEKFGQIDIKQSNKSNSRTDSHVNNLSASRTNQSSKMERNLSGGVRK